MRRILPAIFLALLVSWGCQKKPAAIVATPAPIPAAEPAAAPPAVTPPVVPTMPAPLEPAPLPKTITSPSNLEIGQKNFIVGNYAQAAKAFEEFLRNNPKARERDQALFQLGLSRALAGDSAREMRQAEAAFRQLIAEFPNSPYRNQAEFILGMQVQIDKLRSDVKEREDRIKKLTEELQTLKEIDLQRRPSRPE